MAGQTSYALSATCSAIRVDHSLQRMPQSPLAKLGSTTFPCMMASHFFFSSPSPTANPKTTPLLAAHRTISRSLTFLCPCSLFSNASPVSCARSALPFSPPTLPLTSDTCCGGRFRVPLRMDNAASRWPSTSLACPSALPTVKSTASPSTLGTDSET